MKYHKSILNWEQRKQMSTQLAGNQALQWQILQTARFFFRNKGFDNTTVEDITEFLNISDAHFSYFYNSLDEILELLWAGILSEN